MARTRQRVKGRRDQGSFLALPHSVLDSPEFAALSGRAVKLLLDLGAQYRGSNNGDLCAAWRLMANRGWRSRDTLGKALQELERAGWILRTRQGGRHRASLYALTWRGIDECGGKHDEPSSPVPSNLWRSKTETVASPPSEVTRPACQSEAVAA